MNISFKNKILPTEKIYNVLEYRKDQLRPIFKNVINNQHVYMFHVGGSATQ